MKKNDKVLTEHLVLIKVGKTNNCFHLHVSWPTSPPWQKYAHRWHRFQLLNPTIETGRVVLCCRIQSDSVEFIVKNR